MCVTSRAPCRRCPPTWGTSKNFRHGDGDFWPARSRTGCVAESGVPRLSSRRERPIRLLVSPPAHRRLRGDTTWRNPLGTFGLHAHGPDAWQNQVREPRTPRPEVEQQARAPHPPLRFTASPSPFAWGHDLEKPAAACRKFGTLSDRPLERRIAGAETETATLLERATDNSAPLPPLDS